MHMISIIELLLLMKKIFGTKSNESCIQFFSLQTLINTMIREAIPREKCSFFEHCSNGGWGGVKPMFKNYVVNFV